MSAWCSQYWAAYGEHLLEMAATKDQHPVKTLTTHRADETLGEHSAPSESG